MRTLQNRMTVVLPFQAQPEFDRDCRMLLGCAPVQGLFLVHPAGIPKTPSRCRAFQAPSITDSRLWNRLLGQARSDYLLLVEGPGRIVWGPCALERLLEAARTTEAGMVYSDYQMLRNGVPLYRPVNDYQRGSIRDDFHFGRVRLICVAAARSALKKYGAVAGGPHAGLYDLRLKISADHALFRLQEPLYTTIDAGEGQKAGRVSEQPPRSGVQEKHFAYVDPRNEVVQRAMEVVATAHLKRIGAWMQPACGSIPAPPAPYPVEASVVIPVRNRRGTVAEALRSALSQRTDFPFNVLCVDNHSTDGTTRVVAGLARKFPSLRHLIPDRSDLGIGGCWNAAVADRCCGRYAVQLDSDDLYSGPHTLQKIVDRFRQGDFAMVIGSYTLVNERLEVIPPGLIDHREWTDANGLNNALRIHGLGAPRAFQTELLRRIGFLNVSYGEDYAMALRLLREYRIRRIYENLYLCRRWEGNTDAALTAEQANRNDAFKDSIRTLEIMARQALSRA